MAALVRMPRTGAVRSWADAEAAARAVPELPDAVARFRAILGGDWWCKAAKAQLAAVFHTTFQHGPREWVRLHHLVRVLEGVAGLDLLVRQGLGSTAWNNYVAAVMTLEFCARAKANGLAVELVANRNKKIPDAHVKLSERRWVTIEFKGLHHPDEQQRWDDLLQHIFDGLVRRNVDLSELDIEFTGSFPSETDLIVDQLVAIKTNRTTDYRELSGGAGRARFMPGSQAIRWPTAQADDLTRSVRNLQTKWWRQLDGVDGPTVLVVRTNTLFPSDPSDIVSFAEDVAPVLGSALAAHPMVGAILLYEEPFWGAPQSSTLASPMFRLVVGSSEGGHRRTALLVPNAKARAPLNHEEQDRLVGPAMVW